MPAPVKVYHNRPGGPFRTLCQPLPMLRTVFWKPTNGENIPILPFQIRIVAVDKTRPSIWFAVCSISSEGPPFLRLYLVWFFRDVPLQSEWRRMTAVKVVHWRSCQFFTGEQWSTWLGVRYCRTQIMEWRFQLPTANLRRTLGPSDLSPLTSWLWKLAVVVFLERSSAGTLFSRKGKQWKSATLIASAASTNFTRTSYNQKSFG